MAQVRDLLTFLARLLVREPGQVSVKEIDDDRSRSVELRVAPDDRGRVIGKEGRTAKALRTVVAVATARDGMKAKLDIVD
jgi:predicted RNA-binding protein YlqC (UPF0109 family)